MGNLHTTLETLQQEVANVVTGLKFEGKPIVFDIGLDWPAETRFHQIAKCQECLICIVDMQRGRTQDYLDTRQSVITYPLGVGAVLNKPLLPALGTVECTLVLQPGMTAVQEHDAVGIPVHRGSIDNGATARAGKNETLTSLAAKLAGEINTRPVLKDWVSASASGPVVTITNLLDEGLKLEANCGNIEDRITELGKSAMTAMVAVFTSKREIRKIVGIELEETFRSLTNDRDGHGLPVEGDYPISVCMSQPPYMTRDDSLADLYRQNFMLELEYTNTRKDRAYAILVPIQQTEIEN